VKKWAGAPARSNARASRCPVSMATTPACGRHWS